jgi:hypothetical protein
MNTEPSFGNHSANRGGRGSQQANRRSRLKESAKPRNYEHGNRGQRLKFLQKIREKCKTGEPCGSPENESENKPKPGYKRQRHLGKYSGLFQHEH